MIEKLASASGSDCSSSSSAGSMGCRGSGSNGLWFFVELMLADGALNQVNAVEALDAACASLQAIGECIRRERGQC